MSLKKHPIPLKETAAIVLREAQVQCERKIQNLALTGSSIQYLDANTDATYPLFNFVKANLATRQLVVQQHLTKEYPCSFETSVGVVVSRKEELREGGQRAQPRANSYTYGPTLSVVFASVPTRRSRSSKMSCGGAAVDQWFYTDTSVVLQFTLGEQRQMVAYRQAQLSESSAFLVRASIVLPIKTEMQWAENDLSFVPQLVNRSSPSL